jgi:Tfp pilus assembly protein PilF
LRRDAAHVGAMNNLGLVLAKQGNLPEAESFFLAALRIREDFADAHNNLGSVRRAQGQSEAARESFRRALAIDPTHRLARENLSQLESR